MSYAEKILKAVEDGILTWESVARELVAESSEDDLEYATKALGIEDYEA